MTQQELAEKQEQKKVITQNWKLKWNIQLSTLIRIFEINKESWTDFIWQKKAP